MKNYKKYWMFLTILVLVTVVTSIPVSAESKASKNKKAMALYEAKGNALDQEMASRTYFKYVGKKYVDITGDGIKEALFCYREGSGVSLDIYTYKNGAMKQIYSGGGYGLEEITVYKKSKALIEHQLGKGDMYEYYKLSNGEYKEVGYRLCSVSYTNGKWRYSLKTANGYKTITKRRFNAAINGIKKGKKMTIKIPF